MKLLSNLSRNLRTYTYTQYHRKYCAVIIPERDWLKGKPMCRRVRWWHYSWRWRVHWNWVRQHCCGRWQRAVRRWRYVLQVWHARRSSASHSPPPRRLLCLTFCSGHTPFPFGLHRTVHISTRRYILHLHYVHVHTGHILSARLARNAHRDRVRLTQRAGRRHGQPHLVAGYNRAKRRARMTTAVRRLGRADRVPLAARADQCAIGARAREGR